VIRSNPKFEGFFNTGRFKGERMNVYRTIIHIFLNYNPTLLHPVFSNRIKMRKLYTEEVRILS